MYKYCGTVTSQSRAIVSIDKWAKLFENLQNEVVLCFHAIKIQIPDPSWLDITRMLGSMIKRDTCNNAHSQGINLEQTSITIGRERNHRERSCYLSRKLSQPPMQCLDWLHWVAPCQISWRSHEAWPPNISPSIESHLSSQWAPDKSRQWIQLLCQLP